MLESWQNCTTQQREKVLKFNGAALVTYLIEQMKKTALTGILALGLVEISSGTPAAAQGANQFTGPYIGAHAGWYSGQAQFNSAAYTGLAGGNAPERSEAFDFQGALGGVQAGYNFALGPFTVTGIEVDWSRLGSEDAVTGYTTTTTVESDGFAFQHRSELELEWQSTIRGRFGFVTGNTLFYATGGVAFLHVNWSETASEGYTSPGSTTTVRNHSKSKTLVGAVVGGGIEVALTPTITIGTDYLYENFGNFNSVPHGTEPSLSGRISDIDIHKVRVRVNFKFGGLPN